MDDNNKYNRNKDYEPDNFDDEVAFPARRSNAPKGLPIFRRITAITLTMM